MYKEVKVDKLKTGDLATLYQKVGKLLRRVPGGCLEMTNNNSRTAASHRLWLNAHRTDGGGVDVTAVKTIDVIRHQRGFPIEDHKGYVMKCANPRCFNPEHQVRPKARRETVNAEQQLAWCHTLRKHGWSTAYQMSETSPTIYQRMLRDCADDLEPYVDPRLYSVLSFDVIKKIVVAFQASTPTFADLLTITGCSQDDLLLYGFAVSIIESRSKNYEDAMVMEKVVDCILQGLSTRHTARMVGWTVVKVLTFKGSLYG